MITCKARDKIQKKYTELKNIINDTRPNVSDRGTKVFKTWIKKVNTMKRLEKKVYAPCKSKY
jgi:hypothetical protein